MYGKIKDVRTRALLYSQQKKKGEGGNRNVSPWKNTINSSYNQRS